MVIDGTEKTLDSSSELSQQPMRESSNPMFKMNSLEDKTELDSVCNVMSIMDLNSVDKDVTKLSDSEMLEKSENNKNVIDKEVVIDTTISMDAVIGNLEAIKISKAVDESADNSECGDNIKLKVNEYRKCLELVDNQKNQHKECEKQIAQDHDEYDDENDNVNDDDILVSRGPCGGIPAQNYNHNSVPYNPSSSIPPELEEFLTDLTSEYNYPMNFMPKNFDDPNPKFRRPNANVTDIPEESVNFDNVIYDSGSFNPLVTPRIALMPNNSTNMQLGLENNWLDLKFDSTSNFMAPSAQYRPTVAGSGQIVPSTELISADINEFNMEGILSTVNVDDIEAFAQQFSLEGLQDLQDLLDDNELDTCCDPRLKSENPASDMKSRCSPTSLRDSGIGSPGSQQMPKSPDVDTLWPNSPLSELCLPSPVSSTNYEETTAIRASSKRKLEPPSNVLPPANGILDNNYFPTLAVEKNCMLLGSSIPKCVEDYTTSEEIRIEAERKRNNMEKNKCAGKPNEKPKPRVVPPDVQRRPILPKPSDASTSRPILSGSDNAAQQCLPHPQLHPFQQQQLHQLIEQQLPDQLQQRQFIQQAVQLGGGVLNSKICGSPFSNTLWPQTSTMTQQIVFSPTQPANVTPAMGPRQVRSRPQQARTPPRSRDEELRVYRWIAEITKERLIQQDEHGLSLLHQTVMNDKTTTLQVEAIVNRLKREGLLDTILAMGSEVNKTPLCLAVMVNRPELVKLLIDNGADVNVKLRRTQDGITIEYYLLHYIANKGSIMQEVLKQLLTDQKINVDVFDSYGMTPLHLAVKSHKQRCLNQNGGNGVDSQSIIYILADMGGANLNIGDHTGRTPLHYAIEKRDRYLVEWYLALTVHIAIGRAAPGSNSELDARAVVQRYITTPTNDGMNALTIASTLTPDNQQKAEIINLLLQKNS